MSNKTPYCYSSLDPFRYQWLRKHWPVCVCECVCVCVCVISQRRWTWKVPRNKNVQAVPEMEDTTKLGLDKVWRCKCRMLRWQGSISWRRETLNPCYIWTAFLLGQSSPETQKKYHITQSSKNHSWYRFVHKTPSCETDTKVQQKRFKSWLLAFLTTDV